MRMSFASHLRLLSGVVLLAAAAFAVTPARVEAQTQPTPPEHYTLDPRGVDLVTGQFIYEATDLVVGQPGQGGLVHSRVWVPGGWRDTLSGTIKVTGSTYVVSLGAVSEVFIKSGTTFTPVSNRGATLVQTTPALLTFTTSDGTVATYSTTYNGSTTPYLANNAALMNVRQPNGETITLHWHGYSYCRSWDLDPMTGEPGACTQWANAVRVAAVSNNRGYQVNFRYAEDEIPIGGFVKEWLRRTGATGVNRAVDSCDPYAHCTGSRTWPSVEYSGFTNIDQVTDQSGRITTYAYGSGGLSGVRSPGATVDDFAITYASGRVASVTDASGAWNYTYSDAGTVRTTTTTGPLGQQLVVMSDQTIGRATSVTNALSQTTSYAYDAQRRLQRVTQPEGDYAEITYDGRGNVITTTSVAKPGSGLANIVTSATYPVGTCVNPVICNRPISTTDARGNVTDYNWDSTHGGLLSVTQPTPTTGADRPQTRYAYAPQTAYFKNTGGGFSPSATSVTLPTTVSACATGTSCANAANEVRMTITYGATGVGNNLLPTTVSQGSGVDPAMAVTTTTYTPDSDVETVDGPLPGADDRVLYRYDTARRPIGVVGPDPDGPGPLLNRAQRTTYDARGLVTLSETGTTAGYGDPAWAGFTALLKSQAAYDDFGRPIETRQLSAADVVASVQQVSYDAAGRPDCTALRMNPAAYGALPTSACTAGTVGAFGPDRISRVEYDVLSRPVTSRSAYGLPEVVIERVAYSPNGQTTSLTDGRGNVSMVEYDGFDRPVRLRYPNAAGGGASTTDYEETIYDAFGRVHSSRNRAGQTTYYGFDALERLTAITAPAGTDSAAFAYDNLGRSTTAGRVGMNVNSAYDALSRVTSETSSGVGAMMYQYDAASRLTRITWPDAFYATYDHDVTGAVTAVRANGATSGAGVLASYGYDNLGQITGVTRGNGAATIYGYDAFARLTSLGQNPTGTTNDLTLDFSYNPADQVVTRTASNPAYAYATTGANSYTRNGLNQILSIDAVPLTYDANQNATGVLGNTYGYDDANRLTTATAAGGPGASSFTFDSLSRLITTTTGAASTRFQYAGEQLAAEYDEATGSLVRRHIPGLGLDGTIVSYAGSGTANAEWLLADERGSVIALTDGLGAAFNINRYDDYGVPAAGNMGRFQYTGQAWLAEAGAYHYRARTYLPQIGRFLQTDPIGYAAGMNLYAYVGVDPVNWVDPLGLERGQPISRDECIARGGVIVPIKDKNVSHCVDDPKGWPTIGFGGDAFDLGDIFSTGSRSNISRAEETMSFRPFRRMGTSSCRTLRPLMNRADVQDALRAARQRSLRTRYEEGFIFRLTPGPGSRITVIPGQDYHSFLVWRPESERQNYVVFHMHHYNGGFSTADSSFVRQGWAGGVAQTPSGGYVINCAPGR